MNKPIVLIYGPKKSGSSLLRQLLDGHSQGLVLPGEFPVKLFMKDRKYKNAFQAAGDYLISNRDVLKEGYGEGFQDINKSSIDPIPLESIPNDILENLPQNLGCIKGLNDFDLNTLFDRRTYHQELLNSLKTLLCSPNDFIPIEAKALCKGMNKDFDELEFIGLKEVGGAGQDASHLFSFLNQYLNSKIIFIIRDPRGILLSRINSDDKHYKFKSSYRRKRIMMQTTALIYKDMLRIYNYYGAGRVHIVRYEELVSNKSKTLQNVARFLNIPFEKILLTPSILSIPKNVTTSIKLVEENKKKVKNQVFTDSVNKWKKGLSFNEKWLAESLNNDVFETDHWKYKRTLPNFLSNLGYLFYALRKKLVTLIN